MSNCARIEKSQDADNADQKLKWFLKVHENITLVIFLPKLLLAVTIYKFFHFYRSENVSYKQKLIKII